MTTIHFKQYKSRDDWLEARTMLGGSDAAAIIGMNPWMSNVDLWEIKTGRKNHKHISSEKLVQYGIRAEPHLRELFLLDHPQYKVEYCENNMFTNDKYPFAHASLDGWITEDFTGRKGILEIKTATIESAAQKEKWNNRIPDNYFCQLCWYMGVMEADFAVLVAQLKYERDDSDLFKVTKHYRFERSDIEEDIIYLLKKGSEFFDYIKNDKRPPLVLPVI